MNIVKRSPLLKKSPALMRDDWLAGVDLPGVPELHAEHVRLVGAVTDADTARWELEIANRREDEGREAKIRAGIGDGSAVTLPALTDRLANVAAAEEQYRAAVGALDEFCGRAVAFIEEQAEEWLSLLDERETAAEEKREEARRLLDEADHEVRAMVPLRNWIGRTAGIGRAPNHVALSALGVPPPPKTLDLANVGVGVISRV